MQTNKGKNVQAWNQTRIFGIVFQRSTINLQGQYPIYYLLLLNVGMTATAAQDEIVFMSTQQYGKYETQK